MNETGEGGGDLHRRGAERRRSRLAQFVFAAESPKRADRRNRVPPCAGDVVPAVAQHDAVSRIESLFGENVGDEVSLVLEAAVEFGAVSLVEIAAEVETVEDPLRIDDRLRSAEKEPRAALLHLRQRLRRAVVDDRVEQPVGAVARPVDGERPLAVVGLAKKPPEGLPERRADDPVKVGLGRRRAAHGVERKAKAADDALGRIGQRPVQIDEEDFAPVCGSQMQSFRDLGPVVFRGGGEQSDSAGAMNGKVQGNMVVNEVTWGSQPCFVLLEQMVTA